MEEHYIKDVGKITYVYGVNLEEHKTVIEKQQKRIAELEQDLEFTTKTANDLIEIKHKLEQELAELKEKAIVPKFKIGQEVFVFDWDKQIRSGRIYEIQTNAVLHDRQPHITYLVDFTGNYSDDVQENDYYEEKDIYATEEAEKKLQELRDGDFSGE